MMIMKKLGRNDPCSCGSGKRSKQCCFQLDKVQIGQGDPLIGSSGLFRVALGHHQAGRLPQAESIYHQILEAEPNHAEALHFLGVIAYQVGKNEKAAELISKAIGISPSSQMYSNLGAVFYAQDKLDAAAASYRKSLQLKPDFADAYHNLGIALQDQGKHDAAAECYRSALSLKPDFSAAFSKLLFIKCYSPSVTRQELYAEHLKYAEQFETPLKSTWRPYPNTHDSGRRLKIGYVSPDFRKHSVAYFIEPILAGHDKSLVEVYCYYNHTQHDDLTDRLIPLADHWVPCRGMADDQLAERIRADSIDILVDLAGHTADNRLLVFARKPAPVQVTYLGYAATTGLSAMDYRFTHGDADPPDNEAYNSEVLFRLASLWCYRPPKNMPDVSPAPMLANGFVTFGSMNNFAKVSAESIEVWAEILRSVPDSRLLITRVSYSPARPSILAQFAAYGIDAHRITIVGKLSMEQFWELHHQVDIALDTFPYNGGTTTCESLWLGLPVVTLIGDSFVSRLGYSLLKSIGFPEMAASNRTEYIRVAVELARNKERLDTLRSEIHVRFAASPLRDETGFIRNLEDAYRKIWQKWCLSQSNTIIA